MRRGKKEEMKSVYYQHTKQKATNRQQQHIEQQKIGQKEHRLNRYFATITLSLPHPCL
jgi:hypothetical protein